MTRNYDKVTCQACMKTKTFQNQIALLEEHPDMWEKQNTTVESIQQIREQIEKARLH